MSNFISNAFMMPNDLIDKGYMAKMKGAALPCYLFIVRKTRGWNKSNDNISISQLVEGTGYKKDAVLGGVEQLITMGIVEKISFQNRPQLRQSLIKLAREESKSDQKDSMSEKAQIELEIKKLELEEIKRRVNPPKDKPPEEDYRLDLKPDEELPNEPIL